MVYAAQLAVMKQTVLIAPVSATDLHGKYTYGTDVSYKCRIQGKVQIVKDLQNNERVSNTTIYIAANSLIDPRSRITLPSGYYPQQPMIINAEPEYGPNGSIHHVVIFC